MFKKHNIIQNSFKKPFIADFSRSNKNFQINPNLQQQMFHLKTNAQRKSSIILFKFYGNDLKDVLLNPTL
jgi:hypothetical protein